MYYCQPANLCIRSNPIFDEICQSYPLAELICGLPNISKLGLDIDSSAKLIICDDLMVDLLDSAEIVHLLSIQIHHSNITFIFTLHNFFAASRFGKTVSRNLSYKIFFYNRLDLRELKLISSQIGNNSNFLIDCFNFLMNKFPDENPYILIDGHFKSKLKSMYVRTHIFPHNNEFQPIVFFP